jgi:membrane-bound lytic murein transglycosylase A
LKRFFGFLVALSLPLTSHAALVTMPTRPVSPRALSATSAMEASLAAHFHKTPARTPVEKRLEAQYRMVLANPKLLPAERRRELFEILESLAGRLAVPGQADLMLTSSADAPRFLDDGDRAQLKSAVEWAIANLKRRKDEVLPFGGRFVKRADLLATMEDFHALIASGLSNEQLDAQVRARFDVYRSPGRFGYGGVLYTAYNDPVFEGSLTPDATHRFPIYKAPASSGISNERFDRGQIIGGALKGKGLELAWLKHPAEAYLFELEGSGLIKLADGRTMRIEYAASNGRKFQGLGAQAERNGLLAPMEIAAAKGRNVYLEKPELALKELARNPRVIFFDGQVVAPQAVQSSLDLFPGRSVATDLDYFPRGGLGFVWLDRPSEFTAENKKPSSYQSLARFIVNHDTGNAIRGPGRIDIYWGADQTAQLAAGQLRQPGSLFSFLKKGTSLLAAKPVTSPTIVVHVPKKPASHPVGRSMAKKPAKPAKPVRLVDASTKPRRGRSPSPSSTGRRSSGSTKRSKRS